MNVLIRMLLEANYYNRSCEKYVLSSKCCKLITLIAVFLTLLKNFFMYNFLLATADEAIAPVPQPKVLPTPRSQTLILIFMVFA